MRVTSAGVSGPRYADVLGHPVCQGGLTFPGPQNRAVGLGVECGSWGLGAPEGDHMGWADQETGRQCQEDDAGRGGGRGGTGAGTWGRSECGGRPWWHEECQGQVTGVLPENWILDELLRR